MSGNAFKVVYNVRRTSAITTKSLLTSCRALDQAGYNDVLTGKVILPRVTSVPIGPSYCHLCDSGYRSTTITIFFYATGIEFELASTFEEVVCNDVRL
jgi:hypothetical protein